MTQRTVFFVSDHSGVTAETLGHSLIAQFDALDFTKITVPFVSTVDKAKRAARNINTTARVQGSPPIVFSTLVKEDVRDTVREIVEETDALFLDFFDSFLDPLEKEFGHKSQHAMGVSHGIQNYREYDRRIEAMNFALSHDDGSNPQGYDRADLVLIGVSRSGKTPTCLYLALQYGVFAANYPLTGSDLEERRVPSVLSPHRDKIYGLTIEPQRLGELRSARGIGRRYASPRQVSFEIRQAQSLFERLDIPFIDATRCSIEELASRILDATRLERRTTS
ncbi:pyruvate, water dikinase regulatory protein [Candidatus Palauibacter polyketidifaciens]|uniref:posphoenolpyruvate synthetase regulatory kinase/phosphorylase PpsR n=1 Tax=Candidatus Palauibacter polyketidifaciens TaxID=3056740 RepID=UPI0023A4B876|nr:pyruvate, water dikinase regulatory protein [Candidatus Palauibacter polyketidifaciens]MDE2719722.1 kinase/pyrophosphorylase [Candidatus Palauibacter polyketidifaciens]